mmetsp:Transcript_50321/g.130987  ORF Transcript_50321/g.130987 Transcript_50321/m.130987 type:complete len:283 (+) Transcript_50321:142-990(+)
MSEGTGDYWGRGGRRRPPGCVARGSQRHVAHGQTFAVRTGKLPSHSESGSQRISVVSAQTIRCLFASSARSLCSIDLERDLDICRLKGSTCFSMARSRRSSSKSCVCGWPTYAYAPSRRRLLHTTSTERTGPAMMMPTRAPRKADAVWSCILVAVSSPIRLRKSVESGTLTRASWPEMAAKSRNTTTHAHPTKKLAELHKKKDSASERSMPAASSIRPPRVTSQDTASRVSPPATAESLNARGSEGFACEVNTTSVHAHPVSQLMTFSNRSKVWRANCSRVS